GGKDKKSSAASTSPTPGSAAEVATGSNVGSAASEAGSAAAVVPDDEGSAETPDDPEPDSGSAVEMVETPPPDTGSDEELAQRCKVSVSGPPSGGAAYQGDDKPGTTLLELDMPCGVEVRLSRRKAKYLNTTRAFTPKAGKGNKVAVKLAKPTFTLKVTSSPAG